MHMSFFWFCHEAAQIIVVSMSLYTVRNNSDIGAYRITVLFTILGCFNFAEP